MRDERAVWLYHQSPGARILKRPPGQPATQSQALVRLVDLGVEEGDPTSEQGVLCVACHLAVGPELVTIGVFVVGDLGVHICFIRAQRVAYHKMPTKLSRPSPQ